MTLHLLPSLALSLRFIYFLFIKFSGMESWGVSFTLFRREAEDHFWNFQHTTRGVRQHCRHCDASPRQKGNSNYNSRGYLPVCSFLLAEPSGQSAGKILPLREKLRLLSNLLRFLCNLDLRRQFFGVKKLKFFRICLPIEWMREENFYLAEQSACWYMSVISLRGRGAEHAGKFSL
jgi:hypothetical protein